MKKMIKVLGLTNSVLLAIVASTFMFSPPPLVAEQCNGDWCGGGGGSGEDCPTKCERLANCHPHSTQTCALTISCPGSTQFTCSESYAVRG